MKYLNNKELGFNKEHVVLFQLRGDIDDRIDALKTAMLQSPDVASVTAGYGFPGDMLAGDEIIVPRQDNKKYVFAKMYLAEEKLSTLLWIFTAMAIFIGCLGLFGLAAFAAEQRTKEISIRKVLGASITHIAYQLSKNFLLLVLIASVIAVPIAWWAMNSWLADFPYKINISSWYFVVTIIIALVVALITISFQSIRAAIANPVKSLKAE